jgi:hypothetical protein
MAGDFKHKTVGTELTQTEFEAVDLHELDGVKFGDIILKSEPPSGYYKVVNLYVEKVGESYKLKVEYEDTPIP